MPVVVPALAALVGVGPLLIGAALAWLIDLSKKIVGAIMAFGAGALLAALALSLVAEAEDVGGAIPVVIGFSVGALVYVGADRLVVYVARRRHEQSSKSKTNSRNPTVKRGGENASESAAIVVGALLDSLPEAVVIGLAAVSGGFPVAIASVIAVSNVSEGLAGTVPLKAARKRWHFVFIVWIVIVVLAMVAAVVGAGTMQSAPASAVAIAQSVAAGALLAMVCNAMIPQAFEEDHAATGLIAMAGFLVAFLLHDLV